MRPLFFALAVVVVFASQAGAKTADHATNELIEKLLTRIDGLEKRVAELEQEKAGPHEAPSQPTPPVTASSAVSPVEAAHLDHDRAPSAESAPLTSPLLHIAGFADFNFSATDLHGPNGGFQPLSLLSTHSGFSEGQFVLHLSSALSSKVSVFSELTFTARADAGTGTPAAPGFNAEVERLIIRYDWNDYFKVSFGRYHTPINYWNTAYHHGSWLQTTIDRPEMTQFGGSFIPVHFIGMLVEGAAPAGGLNLNYDFGLGNGRGQVLSRGGDLGDINNNRAWLVNAFIKPDKLYGLQIGGSVYRDELNPLARSPAREWIESAHLVWAKESPEFIAEFSNVTHKPIDGGVTSNSQAFYAQAAYRLPGAFKLWKPYYRFEYLRVPFSDKIFQGLVPSFDASTTGVRYDITSFAAFKVEYRHYIRRDASAINGAFVQTDFTF